MVVLDSMANTDLNLLDRLRKKDRACLAEMVRLYTSDIYKACLGLGFTASESEDVTQNVWITFFDIVSRFEGKSTVKTFLFGILYKKASEYRKQSQRHEATEDIEQIVDKHFDHRGHWIHSPIAPDRFVLSTQIMSIIEKCLEYLPWNQKMAFTLKEIEDVEVDEICTTLEVTNSHVGVLLFRARNQLRECIESKTK